MAIVAVESPRARKDLVLQEVGKEGLLYDRDGELIHILNVTALQIWKACDGERSVAGLESIIRKRFTGLDGHDVRSDIETLLAQFDERGLLENGNGARPRPAQPQQRAEKDPQRDQV